MDTKYPNIHVRLTGQSGNAFFILGTVIRALKKNDVPKEEILKFEQEATSGNYNNLLQTCMKWVEVS